MTAAELREFVARHRLAVVATVDPSGAPEAAVVGFAVTDAFELVFDTLDTSRKCLNLRNNSKIAAVIGWDDEQTVQCEGIADEPQGDQLEALLRRYFERFPDGPARRSWPGLTYFRVRPTWARYSDFRATPPKVVELTSFLLP